MRVLVLAAAILCHQTAAARPPKAPTSIAEECAQLPPHAVSGSVFKDAGGAWRFEQGVHDGARWHCAHGVCCWRHVWQEQHPLACCMRGFLPGLVAGGRR